MNKVVKRKPDFRRIRPTKTYTLPEISKALNRNVSTVRRWVREGLPVMDDEKPRMILGSELKQWLRKKWAQRKRACQPGQLFCFKCREPMYPDMGTVSFSSKNKKTFTIHAKCSCCGSEMRQSRSLAKLTEIKKNFRPFNRDLQSLFEFNSPIVKQTSKTQNSGAKVFTEDDTCKPRKLIN